MNKLSHRARWSKTFNKLVHIWASLAEEEEFNEELAIRLANVLDKMEVGEWCTEYHPYNGELLSFREI